MPGDGRRIVVKKVACSSSSNCTCSNTGKCSFCTGDCPENSSSNTIDCSDTSCSSSSTCSSSSSCSSSQPKILIVKAEAPSSRSSSGCGNCGKCGRCRRSYQRYNECSYKNNRGCGNDGGDKGGQKQNSTCGSNCIFYDFCAVIRPVKNLALLNGTTCGDIKLFVNIYCNLVTLSWEGFQGQTDSSGIAYVYVNQSFRGLPKNSVFGSYLVKFKGANAISAVEVTSDNNNTIRWYLSSSLSSNNVSNGDSFTVYAGSITYPIAKGCQRD